jgi:hypothetical protein
VIEAKTALREEIGHEIKIFTLANGIRPLMQNDPFLQARRFDLEEGGGARSPKAGIFHPVSVRGGRGTPGGDEKRSFTAPRRSEKPDRTAPETQAVPGGYTDLSLAKFGP